MGFLFTGVFWGSVLVLIGVGAILNSVLPVNIPVGRIIFALILIYLGISLFMGTGNSGYKNSSSVLFGEANFKPTVAEHNYSAVFGKGVLDLRDLQLNGRTEIEANAVFGAMEIRLDPNMPVIVNGSGAFGAVKMPDGNVISFGDRQTTLGNIDEDQPYLSLKATAVFGEVDIQKD